MIPNWVYRLMVENRNRQMSVASELELEKERLHYFMDNPGGELVSPGYKEFERKDGKRVRKKTLESIGQ